MSHVPRLIASLILITSLGPSLWLSGCKVVDSAKHCEQSPTEPKCRACCTKAGRRGATWVDDDCECYEQ